MSLENFKTFYQNNKAISIALILYVIFLILDLGSTLYLGDLYPYLEANILFHKIGILGIFLINCLIIAGVMLYYSHSKDPYMRFIVLLAVISFTIVRVLIVFNNIQIGLNPPTLEEAKAVTTAAKIDGIIYYTILNIIPFVVGVITFILYRLDHKTSIKKK